jgi:hypothetical protein
MNPTSSSFFFLCLKASPKASLLFIGIKPPI